MNVLEAAFFKGFVTMADDGDRMGWHERNGGNATYWLRDHEVEEIKASFHDTTAWYPIKAQVKELANQYFLVTGTGKYFHHIKKAPAMCTGIIQVDQEGTSYRIVWGFENDGKPTSELPTHLMNLAVKKQITGGANRVIYHSHCPNLIALTFILPLEDEVFTRELWEMMTECPIIFPEGVGVVDWMVPGGYAIAQATSELMKQYQAVIWAHHGIFCSGTDFDTTFSLMHTIEKSAEIWIKVSSCVTKKHQSITPDNFRKLADEFHVHLEERFLYEKK